MAKHFFVMGFGVVNGQIRHNNGNVRPASPQEQHMWHRLISLDPGLAQDIDPEELAKITSTSNGE